RWHNRSVSNDAAKERRNGSGGKGFHAPGREWHGFGVEWLVGHTSHCPDSPLGIRMIAGWNG
ncbi:hypothetical protein M3090_15605, partial [Bacteroides sp. ET71]|uniref:hypothetical protein n=1 Tax=Bacteroides sp. ET71 TaxID=2939421 RepID=UPI0020135E34